MNLFHVRFYSMLEHFCECYSDLSGLILCPVLGSITPLFIPNSRIRPIRLIGLCASLITFLYPPVLRIQFDPSTAKSQFIESTKGSFGRVYKNSTKSNILVISELIMLGLIMSDFIIYRLFGLVG